MKSKTFFNNPMMLGFEHLIDDLEYMTRHAEDHYPPYNTVKNSDNEWLIELAVAGFTDDELDIQIKDQVLTIMGEHTPRGRTFGHRGISMKKFKRTFRLSEHVKINGAGLNNGILSISLEYIVPDNLLPRKITIGKSINEVKSNDNNNELLREKNQ